MSHLIYRLGNMQKLSNSGWPRLDLIGLPTAHTRCGVPKLP